MAEKKANKFGQGPPLPPFRALPKRKHFFLQEVFPISSMLDDTSVTTTSEQGYDKNASNTILTRKSICFITYIKITKN